MKFNSIKSFIEHYSATCHICQQDRSLIFTCFNDATPIVFDNFFEEPPPLLKETFIFKTILGNTEESTDIAISCNNNVICLDYDIKENDLIITLELKCPCSYIETSSLKLVRKNKFIFNFYPFTVNQEYAAFLFNNEAHYLLSMCSSDISIFGRLSNISNEVNVAKLSLANIKSKDQFFKKINLRLTFQ